MSDDVVTVSDLLGYSMLNRGSSKANMVVLRGSKNVVVVRISRVSRHSVTRLGLGQPRAWCPRCRAAYAETQQPASCPGWRFR
jgi:hypothetical protein